MQSLGKMTKTDNLLATFKANLPATHAAAEVEQSGSSVGTKTERTLLRILLGPV